MINKATNPKLELKGYCKHCRKHTLQSTKAEKKGSLGLARNK
jgi:ribosomal protein L33